MPQQQQPQVQQDYLLHALLTFQNLYTTYLEPTLPPPLQTLVSTLLSTLLTIQPYISSTLSSLSSFRSNLSHGNPDNTKGVTMISTALLVLSVYVGLKMMNYIRRTIFGWVWVAIKMALFLVVLQVGMYVNSYGWEKTMRDVSWWGGIIWGFVEEALDGPDGNKRPPRGTRGRGAGAGRSSGYGRSQVPVGGAGAGGRTRWT